MNGSVYAGDRPGGRRSAPKESSFDVQFPQARQSYEGLLWTEGKNAFAGTLSMLDRPYSFIAIREGASLAAEEIDLGLVRARRRTSRAAGSSAWMPGPDRFTLDGKPCSSTELTDALSRVVKTEPAAGVLLRVPDAVSFERVRQVVKSIQAAGVKSIRLAPTTDKSDPSELEQTRELPTPNSTPIGGAAS